MTTSPSARIARIIFFTGREASALMMWYCRGFCIGVSSVQRKVPVPVHAFLTSIHCGK